MFCGCLEDLLAMCCYAFNLNFRILARESNEFAEKLIQVGILFHFTEIVKDTCTVFTKAFD